MRLAELLAGLSFPEGAARSGEAATVLGSPDRDITGIAYHSQEVRPGDLFAALRGRAQDGHRFAAEASRRGAAAVLVDHPLSDISVPQVVVPNTRRALAVLADTFYGHPSRSLWLCGVTGTKGKTTTAFLIDAILRGAGQRTAVIGTLGVTENDAPKAFHATRPTTPEAPDLQRLLKELCADGVDRVVMEVTSHALDLERVDGCRFRAAVFTNVTQDHLDFHASFEEYRDAKARLFAMVDPDGVCAVNADDSSSSVMIARSRARVWTYGLERPADVRGEDLHVTLRGTRVTAVWPGGRLPLTLRLPGRFNVSNALAATAVALTQGIDPQVIRTALEGVAGIPGRFELVDEGQDFAVIVDYAHTPDSLEKVLRLAGDIGTGRRVAVFGCGGDRDRTKRPIMGRIATTLADYTVITSDNPRSEDPLAIIREIEAGAVGAGTFETEPDRRRAIERGIALARPGDVVVIAGKGHETYQILRDRTIEFDDRQVAREILRKRKGAAPGRS